jgi:hypothetical protein
MPRVASVNGVAIRTKSPIPRASCSRCGPTIRSACSPPVPDVALDRHHPHTECPRDRRNPAADPTQTDDDQRLAVQVRPHPRLLLGDRGLVPVRDVRQLDAAFAEQGERQPECSQDTNLSRSAVCTDSGGSTQVITVGGHQGVGELAAVGPVRERHVTRAEGGDGDATRQALAHRTSSSVACQPSSTRISFLQECRSVIAVERGPEPGPVHEIDERGEVVDGQTARGPLGPVRVRRKGRAFQ